MKRIIVVLCIVALCLADHGNDKKSSQSPGKDHGKGSGGKGSGSEKQQEGGHGGHGGGHGGHGGPPGGMPNGTMMGCNMTNYPKGVDGRQCCPSKPKTFSSSTMETCKPKCSTLTNRTEQLCCMSKCMKDESGVFDAKGALDQAAAIKKLMSTTTDQSWNDIVSKIVPKCVADAPKLVEDMKAKNPNYQDPCGDELIKATAHCISHELFVQCPTNLQNNTNPDCAKLFDFAKTCPAYPFFGHGRCQRGEKGEHGHDGKSGDAKSGSAAAAAGGNTQSKGNQAKGGAQSGDNKQSKGPANGNAGAKNADNKNSKSNNNAKPADKKDQSKPSAAPPKKN